MATYKDFVVKNGLLVLGATIAQRNAGTGVFDFAQTYNGTLTANRTLTWNLNDVDRTVSLGGNITTANNFTTAGNFALTLTATAATTATLPSGTVTLVGTTATQTLSNKTFTAPVINSGRISVTASVTAGTDAQGQGALTTDLNVVATAANNPSAVTLPTGTVGRSIMVFNRGTNPVNVYPASGASIDGLAANTSVQIPPGGRSAFWASTTTTWHSNRTNTDGAGILLLSGNVTVNGAFNTNLTLTGETNLTLPTTGTLATTESSITGTSAGVTGGATNQILYQTGSGVTSFVPAPSTGSTFLQWTGSGFAWASAGGSSATTVGITEDSINANRYLLFSSGTGTSQTVYANTSNLSLNPSSGSMTIKHLIVNGTNSFSSQAKLNVVGATVASIVATISSVDTSADVITTTEAHGFSTGDGVIFRTTDTLPAPLGRDRVFYVQVLSTTTFAVHTTPSDAISNASRINFTTAGAGTNTVHSASMVQASQAAFGGNVGYIDQYFYRQNTTATNWTSGGIRLQARVDGSAHGYIEFNPENNNQGIVFGARGQGYLQFSNNQGEALRIVQPNNTTPVVNFWELRGGVAGSNIRMAASNNSSDANVGVMFTTKGTGDLEFHSANMTAHQFTIKGNELAVNNLYVSGSAATNDVTLGVEGSDTNASINVATQGTGVLKVNGKTVPTITYSTTAPVSPAIGDRWIDTDDGKEYTYYNSGGSDQWVALGGGAELPANVVYANPAIAKDGDVRVTGSVVEIYAGSAWRQIYPAVYV